MAQRQNNDTASPGVRPRLTSCELEAVRSLLSQRSPDSAFTAAEAAIYTGRSTRTLKRAIDAGVGPRREKNPDVSGQAATNRHTRYRKGDLDAWREGLIGFAMAFLSFDDLAADAPWVIEDRKIVGHLLELADIEAVLEVLKADAVEFLRLDEALARAWCSAGRRKRYQEVFDGICTQVMQATAAAAQHDALRSQTGLASGDEGPDRL